jgi:hypothetical protein
MRREGNYFLTSDVNRSLILYDETMAAADMLLI